MTFFNEKEEVIQIELTQYGKYLLSKGKWKPAYYAFFDDDIIYDGKYANISETPSQAVDRIKQSPRSKVQYVFTGIEEQVKKNLELIKQKKEQLSSLKLLPKQEKHYTTINPLGTSLLGEKKAPSFLINILKGKIQTTELIQTGDKPNIRTPKIILEDVIYKRNIEKYNKDYDYSGFSSTSLNRTKVFEDNKMVTIEEDYIILDMLEKNVDNLSKNFEIELFLVEKNKDTNEEEFTQLHFDDAPEFYKNGILLDPKQIDITKNSYGEEESARQTDPNRVTNYFEILVDNQIRKDLLCKLLSQRADGIDSIYASNLDCEDIINNSLGNKQSGDVNNLYRSSYDEEKNKC